MEASGHIGDVTLVQIVDEVHKNYLFVNFVNKG